MKILTEGSIIALDLFKGLAIDHLNVTCFIALFSLLLLLSTVDVDLLGLFLGSIGDEFRNVELGDGVPYIYIITFHTYTAYVIDTHI